MLPKKIIENNLTPTQYRRYMLYVGEGLTQEQIAIIEGVAQPNITKSLKAARKRIKKRVIGYK